METTSSLTSTELRAWLISYLSLLLGIDRADVDSSSTFDRYGLDSSAAVGLSGDLSDLLGREFEVTLAYDFPSIDALVEHFETTRVVRPA